MRVAICLSGEMRGCPKSLRLLREHVIVPFQVAGANVVDLFIHTRRDPWWMAAVSLPYRALWVEENRRRDENQILSVANPKSRGSDPGAGGRRAFLYQSYLQQYESLLACASMVARAERQDGKAYDWVVRSRPDCYLEAQLPVEQLVPGKVNVPWNDWWPYEVDGTRWDTCTDKFAVGSSTHMQVYLSKLDDLQEFCTSYRIHGEAFTVWQLNKYNVHHVRHEGMKIHQSDVGYKFSLPPDARG